MNIKFHKTHKIDADQFPFVDYRDASEVWIWINKSTHIRINTTELISELADNEGFSPNDLLRELGL